MDITLSTQHIARFDFIPMFVGWGVLYAIAYLLIPNPKGLQQEKDLKERESKRLGYYNSYISLVHAVAMVVLSKFSD